MTFPQLNFPPYAPRLQKSPAGKTTIFDPVRKRFVALTPEEWVRQHLLNYLIAHKAVPPSLIAVEARVRYNTLKKRSDIVVYGSSHKPLLIAECKAPGVPLSRDTLNQVLMYHASFSGQYLVLTNGMSHMFCKIDQEGTGVEWLEDLPAYPEMVINPKP